MDQGHYAAIAALRSSATNDSHHGRRTYITLISLLGDDGFNNVSSSQHGTAATLKAFGTGPLESRFFFRLRRCAPTGSIPNTII